MADLKKYAPKDFSKLRGLAGISNDQLDEHFKLYEGYVKRTNALTEKLFALASEGKASGADPVYAELTRRLGFEYGGMVNHEYYFGNLTAGAQAEPPAGSKFRKAVEASYGKYDLWLADFKAVATMPGHRLGHDLPGSEHRLALQPLSSRCTRTTCRPASAPCWRSTAGSTPSCATTRPSSAASTSRPSSRTSTGRRSTSG